jgi:predicted TIM-barrel fold metal-dependent hydrolase
MLDSSASAGAAGMVDPSPPALTLIDTDIHHEPDHGAIARRLPPALAKRGFLMPGGFGFANPHALNRTDATPPNGNAPGSDPDFMLEHHFEPYGIDYGILHPGHSLGIGVSPDYRYAAAVCTAYNDYMRETWLAHDKRFLAGLFVSQTWPEAAAKEIRRVGGDPKFPHVIMASATRIPLGHVSHWPMYEAAEEMGLPIALHPGTEGRGISGPPTAAGWPSSYFEWHTDLSQNYMAQITSLVLEGVFQKFPKLRFVGIEGGVAWLPHLMWRLDKNWKGLRETTPWLVDPPSEVIRRHVRLTTQPIEEPEKPEHLRQIFEMVYAEQTLMFSSDYPHWDGDSPTKGLPRLEPALRDRIMWQTAAELYNLEPHAE